MPRAKIDSKTFLANLRRSGLVSRSELDAALARIPLAERAKTIARALVKEQLITKFQAQLLLAGRNSGFVLGQYRILDELGVGGMGRVFKAQHITMGRTVALKVLAPRHTKTEKARQLFLREVQAAGRLMHPNIVTAHDANQVDGRHYLVMEFIDGPSLDQLVREGGQLPVGLACDITRQVACGLQYAFEQGMVHRDIKPSNILLQRTASTLTAGYLAKILDFGLAFLGDGMEPKKPTEAAAKNIVLGTPDYLSPEQARNLQAVDIRSDLYSLGCTFYFLLSGQVPFPGGTSINKLVRHTRDEPTPIEQLRPDVPHEVADILRCLMAKEPAHRFQTPADLVDDLAPLAISIPAGWPPARAWKPGGVETVEAASGGGTSSFALEGKPAPAKDHAPSSQPAKEEERIADVGKALSLQPSKPATGWKKGTVVVVCSIVGALLGAAAMAALLLFRP